MIYVVIACHFKNSVQLCDTAIARLRAVLKVATSDDQIVVTGDVPYQAGGPTLGELMKNWLVANNFPERSISLLRGAEGTFSEARIGCQLLKEADEITIISSAWYLNLYGKTIWRRRARENGIAASFIHVENTGGWRTTLLYSLIGLVVTTATFAGLEQTIERLLTSSQKKRREGFTFDGCR